LTVPDLTPLALAEVLDVADARVGQRSDVRADRLARPTVVRPGEHQRRHDRRPLDVVPRHQLPRHAEAVLQPHEARAPRVGVQRHQVHAALAQRGVERVDGRGVGEVDVERDARVGPEARPAVQQREALTGDREVHRQDAPGRPVRRVLARTRVARDGVDAPLGERRQVEGGRGLGLVVEPDAGNDPVGSHVRG
jgi:hypothetical protein